MFFRRSQIPAFTVLPGIPHPEKYAFIPAVKCIEVHGVSGVITAEMPFSFEKFAACRIFDQTSQIVRRGKEIFTAVTVNFAHSVNLRSIEVEDRIFFRTVGYFSVKPDPVLNSSGNCDCNIQYTTLVFDINIAPFKNDIAAVSGNRIFTAVQIHTVQYNIIGSFTIFSDICGGIIHFRIAGYASYFR